MQKHTEMEKEAALIHTAAVVVTYNRKALLQQCIAALRINAPHDIIVVDNGCTDGSAEWLDQQTDLQVVHQQNVGGSGGFHTGIQKAIQTEAEWIWCMDDDVRPHADCLARLMEHAKESAVGILAPRRLMEGKVFTNDFCRYNLTNPFRSMYQERLKGKIVNEPTEIAGTAFEGLCISRATVKKIGLPNKDFFIFCDDTDYCLRAYLSGFRILYIPDALMDKEHFFSNDSWQQKQEKKKWKRPYQVRNSTYLNHRYGQNWAVRYIRSLIGLAGYLLTALVTAPFGYGYHWSDIPMLVRAYRDGVNERLGKY